MNATDLIGIIAGLLTAGANTPQVLKTYRSKSADDLSLRMLVALAIGLVLWVIYGFLSKSLPVTLMNALSLAMILSLLTMKLRYSRRA